VARIFHPAQISNEKKNRVKKNPCHVKEKTSYAFAILCAFYDRRGSLTLEVAALLPALRRGRKKLDHVAFTWAG